MTKRILVMGLPGAGKTTFSQEFVKRLMMNHKVSWFNADAVREQYNDWDFTPEGRQRQVERMRKLAEDSGADYAVCDFVCPTEEYRKLFDADITIWIDTIKAGRFEDTNKVFQPPTKWDYHVTSWDDHWVKSIAEAIGKPTETHRRSLVKAISWRICGTLDTFVISWFITGNAHFAIAISTLEVTTKLFWYWLHERMWLKIKWGR